MKAIRVEKQGGPEVLKLMPKALTVSGGSLPNYLRTPEELMQRANDVIAASRAGWLKLNIGHVLPLAQATQAHELLETRKTEGKLVLSVANPPLSS